MSLSVVIPCRDAGAWLAETLHSLGRQTRAPDEVIVVEAAEKSAASASNEKKEAALEEARKALAAAELSGNAAQLLKASSTLSALEGEKVTGLKPMVLGRGRGRGRGGSWRGGGK